MIISQPLKKESSIELDSDREIAILELWNSSCVYCIKEFPKFQKFYDNYKHEYSIQSVNIPIKRDSLNGFNPIEFVQQKGFDFPVHTASKELSKDLDVNSFPKLLIIQNDTLIFKANMVVPKDKELIIHILEEYNK